MANKQRLQWWIDALRSGKYAHAFNVYRSADDGYCAEGVGMHISGLCPWNNPLMLDKAYAEFYHWLEMPADAKLDYADGHFSVPWLNDHFKLSHSEIAALVETQWLNADEDESFRAYEAYRERQAELLKKSPGTKVIRYE